MTNHGLDSRRSRFTQDHPGPKSTSSQDFVRLATLLYQTSALDLKNTDGNQSIYALAGIPMLFSALRCLLVELNDGFLSNGHSNREVLEKLAMQSNDVKVIVECYPQMPADLCADLKLLLEIRHEIIHPSHRPGPEKNNTPSYLFSLRLAGLLQSTERETDYTWMGQLQSHKLFRWAFDTVAQTVEVLLRAHDSYALDGILESYSRYKAIDVIPKVP